MADRGTRFTNYSSIHSKDAFIGDYQVMYTPGSSPPIQRRKASSRFAASNSRMRDPTQSIIIPSGIPDTSAILPSRGTLRDVHVHYTIPADEKEIVASLRRVQKDLDTAMDRIVSLEQERDLARDELRLLRLSMKKTSAQAGPAPASRKQDQAEPAHASRKQDQAARVEEELFDISRLGDYPLQPSPQKTPKNIGTKRVSLGNKASAKTTDDDDAARLISQIPADAADRNDKPGRASMPAVVVVDEESIVPDATAASNTSRRRYRASLDENMTSAYILPDITLSKAAQAVLHDHDPQHIADCRVCQRLTYPRQPQNPTKSLDLLAARADDDMDNFTAQVTHMIHELNLAEETVRPRIAPAHALAHLKKMLNHAYNEAKQEHGKAWHEYDAIHAPNHSKRHMAAADRMRIWAKKMDEARLNLDQLRDVEEGMKDLIRP
ncbi:hypothetical protein DV737_g5088, partial [Chaetothyriales sp. CBS 132003]